METISSGYGGEFIMLFFLMGALVFALGIVYKSRLLKWLGALPFIGIGVFVAFLVVAWNWQSIFPTPPSQEFKSVFGFTPPADVKELRSLETISLRSNGLYLRFKASPQTIKRITGRGYKQANQAQESYSGAPPKWWKPILSKTTVSYLGTAKSGDSAYENEVLHYDTKTHDAYYEYIGAD